MFLNFSNGGRRVIGLDIGSSSVKLVQLEHDFRGYIVSAAAQAEIVPYISQGTQNPDDSRMAAINKCFKTLELSTRNAVCSISGPEVAVRQFRFPLMSANELEQAVLHEAIQVCPFDIEQSTVDFQLSSQNNTWHSKPESKTFHRDEVCGILVAATNKAILAKKAFAESNQANCVLMDVDGLAILNCVSKFEQPSPGQAMAILNVGHSFTNMVIIQNNLPPFVRDLPFAAENIIRQIAWENEVKEDVIKGILKGTKETGMTYDQIEESFRKTCRKLAQDIIETLRYYMTQEQSVDVQKTYVCGGFSMAKGFIKLLHEVLPGDIKLFDPFENIRFGSSEVKRNINSCGPAFTVAAGLAMRKI